jgi:transcriptional regulator with XRE-family HTH domain
LTIKSAFGEVIRELRKNAGRSQEDIAFDSSLDRSFISLLENGRQQPSLITIFQLAKALAVTPSQIISLVEEKLRGKPVNSTSVMPT